MALSPSARLGPYEIEALIGAGGMGEVYRARDTRLDRLVAIKILSAQDGGHCRHERFAREARLISALSHPHICALYDVGCHEGLDFLVMEYLDGESLETRLARRSLSTEQALGWALQIAGALDAAHSHGVTHRDIKPANIVLTSSGAKLLDFGIAKLLDARPTNDVQRPQETLTASESVPGTTAYMAPEQLEGRNDDPRSDIFAFGVVLYEMLAGRPPFVAPTRARLISAILEHEPEPVSPTKGTIAPALERLVMKCLAKDPDQRWQTARDLASELTWISHAESKSRVSRATRQTARHAAWTVAGVLGLAAVVSLSIGGIELGRVSPTSPGPVRFLITVPSGSVITVTPGAFAVSPDGRHVAFTASSAGGPRLLWLRSLDSFEARALGGTDDALNPFWAPDSRSVAFFSGGKIKKIDVETGTVHPVCEAPDGAWGTWSSTGDMLFADGGKLFLVRASGGTPTRLEPTSARPGSRYGGPEFLPDGRHFLVGMLTPPDNHVGIYVGSIDSPEQTRILDAHSQAIYAHPGYVLFMRDGNLMAQPFDANARQLTGEPVALPEPVSFVAASYRAAFSVSRNGVLAYREGFTPSELVWFDRMGRRLGSIGPAEIYFNPSVSPDGTQVAVSRLDPSIGTSDIWLIDSDRGARAVTSHPSAEDDPVWSPDGRDIIFSSNRGRFMDIYRKRVDSGADHEELIVRSDHDKWVLDWTADGKTLLYLGVGAYGRGQRSWSLWAMPLIAGSEPMALAARSRLEGQGQISPDGRSMAYVSDVTGSAQVHVRPFPSGDGGWQVSPAGGFEPKWRGDGRELFYVAPDQMLMSVSNQPGTTGDTATPVPLFRTNVIGAPYQNGRVRNEYAVTRDGQRFLINQPVGVASTSALRVVVNWRELINGK